MKRRILKKALKAWLKNPRSRLGRRWRARSNARYSSGYWPRR